MRVKGRSLSQLIGHDVGAAYEFGDKNGVQEVFNGAKSDPDVDFLVLVNAKGEVFAALNPELTADLPRGDRSRTREAEHGGRFVVWQPIRTAGGVGGLLVAGFDQSRIAKTRRAEQRTAILVGLPILTIGLVLTVAMSAYVGRTLARLGAVIAKVSQGDLTLADRIGARSDDELGLLSTNLEHMVENLRQIVEKIRESSVQVASSADEISASRS